MPQAEAKGQTLDVAANAGATVIGSRKLLAQAIGNLLENAIKYAPADTAIRLQVRRAPDGIELVASDCGPGIPGLV